MDEEKLRILHSVFQSILQNSVIRNQFCRNSQNLAVVPCNVSLEQRVAFIKKCLSVYENAKDHFAPNVPPTEESSSYKLTSVVTVFSEADMSVSDLPPPNCDDGIIASDLLPYSWDF